MLNEQNLEQILGQKLPPLKLNDIHWRVQDCRPDGLLFYRIGETAEARQLFKERISQAKFGWLIVNVPHPDLPANSSVIEENRWPQIQNAVLDILYPLPVMSYIGVTGTNGKTTTTDLVLQIAHLMGKKGISIGTLGVREYQKQILDFGLTSPSLIDLRKFLHKYGAGKDFCVMEASSHALIQERLYGIKFDAAGWLSFSQDHLDYHKSMDAYFEAKSLIYRYLNPAADLFVPASQEDLFQKLKSISKKTRKATVINGVLPVFFSTQFNRDNLEVAMSLVETAFHSRPKIDYNKLTSPDGRFYIRPYKSNYLIVDFAHTPDALLNICRGIKKSFPGYKLKVLFGCGGDRDRTKRPLMGAVVDEWADEAYVTSDNPRSEDPERIIDDILKGFTKKIPRKIVDRREAVRIAFSELNEKEVLLFAGKGHEDYILINGVKHPYSDIREVDEFVRRNSP